MLIASIHWEVLFASVKSVTQETHLLAVVKVCFLYNLNLGLKLYHLYKQTLKFVILLFFSSKTLLEVSILYNIH